MHMSAKKQTERRCALSRAVMPTAQLIRFVADPSGTLVPDLKQQLPGRGVWVEAQRDCLNEAIRRKVFARALKQPVSVDASLDETVEALMRQRALNTLSMAKKAGAIITGSQRIGEALMADKVALLLHATDAADDGAAKLDRKAWMMNDAPRRAFTIDEMSLALGQPNVVHAAGTKGPAIKALIAELARLSYFREGPSESADLDPMPAGIETDDREPDVI